MVSWAFPSGTWRNIKLFGHELVKSLIFDERVVADRRYNHTRCITPNNIETNNCVARARICSCTEICNRCIKYFKILTQLFRPNVQLLVVVHHACAKITYKFIRNEKRFLGHDSWLYFSVINILILLKLLCYSRNPYFGYLCLVCVIVFLFCTKIVFPLKSWNMFLGANKINLLHCTYSKLVLFTPP